MKQFRSFIVESHNRRPRQQKYQTGQEIYT